MKWLILILPAILSLLYFTGCFTYINPHTIRDAVLSFGVIAPLAFVILFALSPFVPFFSSALALAGGLIFGLWSGSLLIILGAMCSSTVGFWIARHFRGLFRNRKKTESITKLEHSLYKNQFILILLLRLIPLIPFDIISYGAGISSIKYRQYILATFLGIIPGVLVYSNIGANTLDINSQAFYFSIALLLLLTVVSLLLKKKLKNILDI